jgi:hypothetical protein
MKKFSTLLFLAFLGACSSIKVDSPEFRTAYLPSLELNRDKDSCWESTLKGLKERGYEIKKMDKNMGSIETGRRKFNVTAKVVTSGTKYSNGSVSLSQLEQSDKLWIKLTQNESKCTVQYQKARLWNGEEELEVVQGAGGEWFMKNVINPLSREISEQ